MSPHVIKFFPATPAIGFIIGGGASNLKKIGQALNTSGSRVTIKINEPRGKNPLQFCIICDDKTKAEDAYSRLRALEDTAINGAELNGSRSNDWWPKALSKATGEETTKYSHKLIKSLAGIVLGKESANLKACREAHFEVDVQVTNTDQDCIITYEATTSDEKKAFEALQFMRRIEREAFATSQTMCLSKTAGPPQDSHVIDDGLGSSPQTQTTTITLAPKDNHQVLTLKVTDED